MVNEKRGSDQAINYEVESIVITDSSTTDIGRNKDSKGISEPEGSEEIVLSEVAEGVPEEEEEGATAWRAQSPDEPTKLIEEEDEKVTDTPIGEVSSSELKTSENEADSSGVEKTVVRSGTTTKADFETAVTSLEASPIHEITILKKGPSNEETLENKSGRVSD